MSRIRVERITDKQGTGAPLFPNGIRVVGLTSLSNVVANTVSIGGTLTYEDVTNVDSIGMVTARNGIDVAAGGANIVGVVTASTGIDAASNLILKTGGNEKVRISSAGLVGIGTDLPGGKVTVAGISASARLELKRTNTNTTGAIGAINWTALDGHSVANMYALGDGDDEGAHLVFKTTSAAASNDPFNAATVERLRIGSAGQLGIAGANYGTSGQVLTSQGNSAAPQWASVSATPVRDAWTQTGNSDGNPWGASAVWGVACNTANLISRKAGFPTVSGQQMSVDLTTPNGYWTFPSAGTWQITWMLMIAPNTSGLMETVFQYTTDNGSTWASSGTGGSHYTKGAAGDVDNHSIMTTAVISNATTYRMRIKFTSVGGSNATMYGPGTWALFEKLS